MTAHTVNATTSVDVIHKPLVLEHMQMPPALEEDEPVLSPLVLIADDDATTRLLLRKAMQKDNFRVIEARNGRECLDLCEQQQPDLVLMDAVMPEIDGFTCCRTLQASSEGIAPPVLMITSLEDPESIDQIFSSGAADYVAKPIHWALLKQRVHRLQDILKRRQAEASMRKSLIEKESLLKEVHHRVKNNLQIISSLLNLQSGSIKDQHVLDIFKESQNRVRLMALIHEKLYQSDDLGKINLKEYVQSLSYNLLRSYEVAQGDIQLVVESDEIALETDTAVSCGLIINELVSNSLKYAFPSSLSLAGAAALRAPVQRAPVQKASVQKATVQKATVQKASDEKPSIMIEARKTGANQFCIYYRDNGVGLPESIDISNTDTLGLQLVSSLTEQLSGVLKVVSQEGKGTAFSLIELCAS
ncbi:MAG: histidine kinase dimerization/phosphoacceptor domain -containing protein [Cyanobacteria bacterium J06573_11]